MRAWPVGNQEKDLGVEGGELAGLEAVTSLVRAADDLGYLLDAALSIVLKNIDAEIAFICVLDRDTGQIDTIASAGTDPEFAHRASQGIVGKHLAQEVARSGQLLAIEDISAHSLPSNLPRTDPLFRSYAGAPLTSMGQTLGAMSVARVRQSRFGPAELKFLSVIAGQVTWAVESDALRKRLVSSQVRLRERVKELSILYDISREALVADSIDGFLGFIARRLPASMQYQDAMVVVFCAVAGQEYLRWSNNMDASIAEQVALVPGRGTLGSSLVEHGLLLEYGISKVAGLPPHWRVEAVLAVPVTADGQAVGSIAVYYPRREWRFLPEEEHLLRGISEQVTQYLTRDAAERDNQRHVQEVSTLFEVSKALASVVDTEELLPTIQHTLMDTLKPADAGVLFLFDEGTGMLRVASSFGYEVSALDQVNLRLGESMSGKVFECEAPEVWSSPEECASAMATSSAHNRELFKQASRGLASPRSAIGVPLNYRDEKMGVLTVETFTSDERFSDSHLPFLQAFAELIAININQIRLLQETEEARAVEEADRLRSGLIAALAHDMRTPLTSIRGYASALLLEDVEWDEESRVKQLQIIEAEARDLQTMISDLLESSIVDAGLMTLATEPTLIPRIVESLTSEMTRRTARHRFVIGFPSDFPIVDADPRRIEQVLRNLLDNAVKYSPNGGLVVIRGQVAPGEVIVSVADNGVGIAPEHLNRLFEKFFRVKSPLGDKVRGTGLGLPVCRTIVESHGGRIWAESELGKGTTMYFTLPYPQSSTIPEAD